MATFANPNYALYAFVSRLRSGDPKARSTARALVTLAHRGDARARRVLDRVRAMIAMQQTRGMQVGGVAQHLPKLKALATNATHWAARPLHWTFGKAGALLEGTGNVAAKVLQKTGHLAARPFQIVEGKLAGPAALRLPPHVQLPRL